MGRSIGRKTPALTEDARKHQVDAVSDEFYRAQTNLRKAQLKLKVIQSEARSVQSQAMMTQSVLKALPR